MMTKIERHQKMMRNGWSIPLSMAWIFWPMGLATDIALERVPQPPGPEARFRLVDREKFMAALQRLKAVR